MTRTALEVRQNPGGLFAVEDQAGGTGQRFYVHAGTGVDAAGYGSHPDSPVASLDYAIGLCTASKGDKIFLMEGHAETTTAVAVDVAGIQIIGLGRGANRPTLTATTAVTDLINVTAANVYIKNVRLAGAASGVTALLDLSSAATDFMAEGCEFLQAATPLSAVTIVGAERFIFKDCAFRGTADGPDRVFSIEVGCDNWVIEDCRFHYLSGLDNELIKSVAVCLGYIIKNVTVVGIDTLLVNFSSSSAGPPDGLFASGNVMASAALTSVEDMVAAATSKGMAFGGQLYAADVTGKFGGHIPIVSAS